MNEEESNKKENLTVNDLFPYLSENERQELEKDFKVEFKFNENMSEDMEDALWSEFFDLFWLSNKPANKTSQQEANK